MKIADRVTSIQMSGIRKMFEIAKEDSIHLGLGEPDFQPPRTVIEGLKRAVEDGHNKYGPTAGIMPLRNAIARDLKKYHADVSAENVLVTSSGSEALMVLMQSLVNPGDEVLYPNPGFVLYEPQTKMAGGRPVDYPLRQENGFVPQVADLEKRVTEKTSVLIVNSPSNPTGAVLNDSQIRDICSFADEHDLAIVSDEVYDRMVYEGSHISFLGHSPNVFMVNSFSKTFAMTGWRLGYISGPAEYMPDMVKTHYHTVACPPTPIQVAALAGLEGPKHELDAMVSEFKSRRDLIVKLINDIDGLTCLMPKGAFYAFPSYDFNMKSADLAMELLKNGLVSSPGSAFGTGGEGHIRFSYANSKANIEKGMAIVDKVMGSIGK